jgi:adenylosuccinate synthase
MLAEAQHLLSLGVVDPLASTTIDSAALVTTPFHRAVNRLQELARGEARHGSCGMGIGETVADALAHGTQVLRVGDLRQRDRLYAKLAFLRQINLAKVAALCPSLPDTAQVASELDLLSDPDWADWLLAAYQAFAAQAQLVPSTHLHEILQRPGAVIFEGAQGVLLDEWAGFHPHTTWSTTTLANADCLLAEAGYSGHVTRIGLTRGYMTRHGAGPLVTEDAALSALLPDAANRFGAWQQGFRVGWLDLVLLRYACAAVGRLDMLAVTCLDRLAALPRLQICHRYCVDEQPLTRLCPAPTPQDLAYQARLTAQLAHCQPCYETMRHVDDLLAVTTRELGLPVGITSWGPGAADKCWRG